ncbi:MAG: hypothetical protein AB7E72_19535 [Lysobacterales bacterium]
MRLISSWLASDFDAQIAAVLTAIGIEDDPNDPEAGAVVALELGLSDGDVIQVDPDTGEILLRTERAQILRNIEVAAARGDRTISELVDNGDIGRAELRDEEVANLSGKGKGFLRLPMSAADHR